MQWLKFLPCMQQLNKHTRLFILSPKPKQNANKPKIQWQPWLPYQSDCTSPSLWGQCRPSVTWPGPARSGRSASGCGAWCGWWGCPTWSRTAPGRRWLGRWTAQTPGLRMPLAPTGKEDTGIRPTNFDSRCYCLSSPWGPFWTEVAVGRRAETVVVAVAPAVAVVEVTSTRPMSLIISRCYWTSCLSRTILNWSNSRKRSRKSSGRSSGSSNSSSRIDVTSIRPMNLIISRCYCASSVRLLIRFVHLQAMNGCWWMTHRQRDRHRDRQTDSQTASQTERETGF